MYKYFTHLIKNLIVSAHAAKDLFAHLIHGFVPFIKIKHHQPVKYFEYKSTIMNAEQKETILRIIAMLDVVADGAGLDHELYLLKQKVELVSKIKK